MTDCPVISGHRGYKGKYPENTILGFGKCFASGATSFETDLYLTADDVLVVSHDVNTKRTYMYANGDEADFHIPSSSYENDLKSLVNKVTGDKFLTFKTVLDFIIQNDAKVLHETVMLDIKTYNKPRIIKEIFKEIALVKGDYNYWFKRLQFGVWDLDFVKYLNQDEYFQKVYDENNITEKFQLYHISVDWNRCVPFLEYNLYLKQRYGSSRHLFKTTGVSILYLSTWSRSFLDTFMPLAKIHNLSLWTWTINNTYQYDYFNRVCKVAQIREYGIMSDDPGMMVEHKQSQETKFEVTETSSMMGSVGSVGSVRLDFSQRLANYAYDFVVSMVNKPKADFESYTDSEVRQMRPVHPLVLKTFYFFQHLGIF